MKHCLVIGKPNSGKTLFLLNLAEYLGYKEIEFDVERADGSRWQRQYTLMEARMTLVGPTPHVTQALYATTVILRKGKMTVEVRLTDSTGFCEGIHKDASVRQAMAQTLRQLRQRSMILHMIDGVDAACGGVSKIDEQLVRYVTGCSGYAILVNKMDLLRASEGLLNVRNRFPHHMVIPVSALKRTGFGEVRSFVVGAF